MRDLHGELEALEENQLCSKGHARRVEKIVIVSESQAGRHEERLVVNVHHLLACWLLVLYSQVHPGCKTLRLKASRPITH